MLRPVLPLPVLDRRAPAPVSVQLAAHLRGLILRGAIGAGALLPSSRALAESLGIARSTVVVAIEQLAAEGFVSARQGFGVRVAGGVHPARARPEAPPARPPPAPRPGAPLPFAIGAVDAALFPRLAWSRALARAWRAPGPALAPMLGRIDPLGHWPLRQAIAAHMAEWRGVAADPAQIVITSGASESLGLLARALLAPGAAVAVEDPGHPPIRTALARAGARVVPLRVDAEGLDPARLAARRALRAVLVTPSRQFPMGCVMPVARRLALLDWAARNGALVIEDDFDSEFRYRGTPLPALASLDGGARTVYLGSFGKVLSPALRISWMVLPEGALAAIRAALAEAAPQASLVPQPALAGLIAEGQLARHIRRARRAFAARQAALVRAAAIHLDQLLEVAPDTAGMHLVARLSPPLARRMDDRAAARLAEAAGLSVVALSALARLRPAPQGLLLGFAGFPPAALEQAAARLGAALRAR